MKSQEDENKGKWVLSFHGPNTRYFPTDSFSYGDSSAHDDVYCEGLCIAVAPAPVLGAALRITLVEGVRQFSLVVVCKEGTQDALYIRDVNPFSGATADTYDDDFRNSSKRMYNETDNPKGWRAIGRHSCTSSKQGVAQEVKEARTPWFFDSTGTFAQCMREADITLARGDREEVQQGYVRYKLTVSDTASGLEVLDNREGFTFTVRNEVEKRPDYTATVSYGQHPVHGDGPVIQHWWEAWVIRHFMEGVGSYVVGVDYDGTDEKLIVVELYATFSFWQELYRGSDKDHDPARGTSSDPESPNYTYWTNQGQWGGDPEKSSASNYHKELDDGVPGVLAIRKIVLDMSAPFITSFPLYSSSIGSRELYTLATSEGGFTQSDRAWYYTVEYTTNPHHMNIPGKQITYESYSDLYLETEEYSGLSKKHRKTSVRQEEYGSGESVTFRDSSIICVDEKAPQIALSGIWGYAGGHLISDLIDNWIDGGIATLHTYRTIDGKLPVRPDDVTETNEPPIEDAYKGKHVEFHGLWPTLSEALQSISKCYREGAAVADTLGNTAVSMKYVDPSGEVAYYSDLNGSSSLLDSLTSASGERIRYYPLGEV